ncbi:hypothetical protein PINS_up021961 [Pythium insidiosum]|nr:hypothetical protein PINS_up021961 [Pythium insidiosum]
MSQFEECDEYKERVKACYGDWFHNLWGGHFNKHECEQETNEFRRCVQDVIKKRSQKERGGSDERDWIGRARDVAERTRGNTKGEAQRKRKEMDEKKEAWKRQGRESEEDWDGWSRRKADDWRDRGEDWKNRGKESAERTRDNARETADDWMDRARSKKEELKERTRDTKERYEGASKR